MCNNDEISHSSNKSKVRELALILHDMKCVRLLVCSSFAGHEGPPSKKKGVKPILK